VDQVTLQALQNRYGFNEPIFLSDIESEKTSKNTLRQTLKRLVDDGAMQRFGAGVYYIPQKSKLLGRAYFDGNKVVSAKFISRENNIFGYFSGMTFANQLGITSQIPVQKEIVTNKESTAGRNIKIANFTVRLRKSRVTVTNKNWQILQLLDLINEYEKWSEISDAEVTERIGKYIKEKNLTKDALIEYIQFYPDKVAKKLIESRLIYVFAQ